MKIKSILTLGVLSLFGFTSCEKGFDLNSELIPQDKVDPTIIKTYLSTGNPPYNVSIISTTQTPINFLEETNTELYVQLSKPATQDITVEVVLDLSLEAQKEASKAFQVPSLLPLAPEGLLKLSTQSVVVKQGQLKSETAIKVEFDNKELLRSVEGRYFLASVKVTKTSFGVPSTNFGASYIAVDRVEKLIKPFNPDATLEGLTKVEPTQFIPKAMNEEYGFPAENAFDGDPGTYWNLNGYARGGYFQIDFKTPINLAAYRISLRRSSYDYQLKEYELEISYDNGQSWKNLGKESLNVKYHQITGWNYPTQAREFYGSLKSVTGIRIKPRSTVGFGAFYISLADIEIFEQK